jgi:hypothetical protein
LYAKRFINFLHKVFPQQPWNCQELGLAFLLFINYHRCSGKGFPFLFYLFTLFYALISVNACFIAEIILFVKLCR